MRYYKELQPFEGVGLGQTATLDVPIGPRYHTIQLVGTLKITGAQADIGNIFGTIRVKINGRTQRECTGVELNTINYLLGGDPAYKDSIEHPGNPQNGDTIRISIPIHFAEPWRKSYAASYNMSWPTAWPNGKRLQSFQIEVDIPNTANASNLSLKAYADYDDTLGALDTNGNPVMLISRWHRRTVPYTSAGERHITDIDLQGWLQQIDVFSQSSDPVREIRMLVDNDEVFKSTWWANYHLLDLWGMTKGAISSTYFPVVFDRTDNPADALLLTGRLSADLILTLPSANATTKLVTIIYQYYGPPA